MKSLQYIVGSSPTHKCVKILPTSRCPPDARIEENRKQSEIIHVRPASHNHPYSIYMSVPFPATFRTVSWFSSFLQNIFVIQNSPNSVKNYASNVNNASDSSIVKKSWRTRRKNSACAFTPMILAPSYLIPFKLCLSMPLTREQIFYETIQSLKNVCWISLNAQSHLSNLNNALFTKYNCIYFKSCIEYFVTK